ncbi:unnamed protein product [Cylicocyclus nassatus]|uniref:Carbohydrate sulfotransferase n=1 Tax=Cylicocyclus nassatus TaxID=53992 RepID=A0AA36MCG6_CYLNA|nr:unnamed protein product [Cylicocyclus nassatus]
MRYVSLSDSNDDDCVNANHEIAATRPILRSGKLPERRKYLMAGATIMTVFLIYVILKSDKSSIPIRLSKEELLKIEENYRKQDLIKKEVEMKLDHIDNIKANNSDKLPPRKFTGKTAYTMCRSGAGNCVQRYARIFPFLVAAPKYKLMACLIQKSMATVMSAIMCYLFREKEFISHGRSILSEFANNNFCEKKNKHGDVEGMKIHLNITDLSAWKFIMVTREPVDRFLSGFLDRCIRAGDSCNGCGNNMTCFLETEYERALDFAYAERMHFEKPTLSFEDLHIFPQTWHCSMQRHYDYKFIRYSSDPSETLLEDLSQVLRAQNVSDSSIDYIAESLKSGRTFHSTVTSSARAFLEQRLRSSPYLMELLVRLFYHDYIMLGYEMPKLDFDA